MRPEFQCYKNEIFEKSQKHSIANKKVKSFLPFSDRKKRNKNYQ